MNSFIETFNRWGAEFLGFAWPMLWQSSVLIAILFGFNRLLRRRLRASIRYALWLVVLVKLCVPPTLALPTSPAWWMHSTPPPAAKLPLPNYTVTYDNSLLPETSSSPLPVFIPPSPAISPAAWLLAASLMVSFMLLFWLSVRWWQIAQRVGRAFKSERLTRLAAAVQPAIGLRSKVRVKVTTNPMSPAVCGLFYPAILIPRALVEKLSDEQLRAVLLHELIHLRRCDVGVNFVQALLQILYWWHPLVWLANARIRRVREEAVDDAVMLALRDEAEAYAPTLLEVARFALNRPRVSLGLVGILESRQSLRQRIERLVDFHPPRHAGLTLVSLLGIVAFTAIAVPMGQGPAGSDASIASGELQTLTMKVDSDIFIKNMKAQVGRTLRSTNDSSTDILTDILGGESVDCAPPHVLTINAQSGEISLQNTPEALGIFRRVIEQLNRADGKCALPLKDPSVHRKMVLITAEFYSMPDASFGKLIQNLDSVNPKAGNFVVQAISTEHLAAIKENIKSLGLKPFQRPRIQTSSGLPARFFAGDVVQGVEFNGVELDCCPLVSDGLIKLSFRVNVSTGLDFEGATLASGRVAAENHGGIIVCANDPTGSVHTNLVLVMGIQILTNNSPTAVRQEFYGRGNSTNNGMANFFQPASHVTKGTPIVTANSARELPVKMDSEATKTLAEPEVAVNGGPQTQLRAGPVTSDSPATTSAGNEESTDIGSTDIATRKMKTGESGQGSRVLLTRTFKIDSNAFVSQLQRQQGMDVVTNHPGAASAAARKFFTTQGVNFELPPGKAIVFNDRNGMLLVKATAADLQVIKTAVETFGYTAPQIHIKARFLEVSKSLSKSLQPLPKFSNGAVVMTAGSTRELLKKLDSESAETLAEPEVLTASGRQAQVRATQVKTLVSGISFEMQYDDLNLTTNKNDVTFETHPLETGPVLDSIPTVLADGYTIDLKTTASMTEFFGYAPPKSSTPASSQTADYVSLPLIHPSLRHQEAKVHAKLWDGQTLALTRFKTKTTGEENFPKKDDRQLLVLITVTVVAPGGNRLHSDEDMPFAENKVPPQSAD